MCVHYDEYTASDEVMTKHHLTRPCLPRCVCVFVYVCMCVCACVRV